MNQPPNSINRCLTTGLLVGGRMASLAIGVAAALMLAGTDVVLAHSPAADRFAVSWSVANPQVAVSNSDEAVTMVMSDPNGMGGMDDMGAMMRPDMAPPEGIMGGMSPRKGALMLSLRYMHMRMDGNRDGTDDVSTSEVLAQFHIAPLNMNMDMLMASAMYGITDEFSVMAMVPYIWKEMDHVNRIGAEFTTRSEGLGDVRLIAGYDVYRSTRGSIKLTAGLSFPTGSTNEMDDTPAGPNQSLPYPMQIGSGTWDLLPGITYTGKSSEWSWGGQLGAIIRLGENDRDYTFGNIYQATAWGARKWTNWLSSSLRLEGEIEEDIDGADPLLNPLMAPTADPNLRAGKRLSVGLGLNFMVPTGALRGLGFSVEGIVPFYQNLDGPQLERDYTLVFSLRMAF